MKQKKIKRIIIFLVMLILVFTTSYFLFLNTFINNTTYFKPFSVEIQGLNNEQFKAVKCQGISPNGRIIILKKNDENCCFYSNNFMHLNDIVCYCNDSVFAKMKLIKLNFREESSSYTINFSNGQSNTGLSKSADRIHIISFKNYINPNYSKIKVFFAIFLWPGWFRFLYFIIFFVLIIFILIRYIKYILSFLKKIQLFIERKFEKINIENTYIRILFSAIVCFLLSVFFIKSINFTGVHLQIKESITQTIAVNFAHGHGFPKSGFVENFENYNINQFDATRDLSYSFLKEFKGVYMYHNPPIYALFIGSVYNFIGINPTLLKQIQLIMLIMAISLLPVLGYKLAGKLGFWSGLISTPIALNGCYGMADKLEPDFLIVIFLFILIFLFQKTILEEKYYKVIIIGLTLSIIILTQLTLILLPFFMILYLLFLLIKKPSRRAFMAFIILITSFVIPIFSWSLYANIHKNSELITENNSIKLHNALLNRNFNSNDMSILDGLENQFEIKNNDIIINDGGWVGPLSVYEKYLVDNILIPSLLYNKIIIIATKTAPELLFIAHNEYCTNGAPNIDWAKHSDSYYNNDNKSYPPFVRVFLFYLNHPKQLFIGSINKLYNGFSSFKFLFVFIWVIVFNFLFYFLQPLHKKYKQKNIRNFKILISVILLISAFFINDISYLIFYSSLIVLFFITFVCMYNKKINQINTPESFIIVLLSLMFFALATFGEDRCIVILNFMFVYQAIYSLIYFSLSNNFLPNSIRA